MSFALRPISPGHTQAISDRRSLLEATLQALPIGVTVHDEHGRCILANAAALDLGPAQTDDRADADLVPPQDGEEGLIAENGRTIESRVRVLRSEQELYCLTTLVDVTRQHAVERELLQRAYIDALTGLPNRTLIEQHVETLIASHPDGSFALAFIDLDGFKHINDYYSHAAGDALLTKVADRILSAVRESDMLARIGGDEFVLVLKPGLDGIETQDVLLGAAERLKEPFFVDGHEIFASASVGVSLFPDHGLTYDTLRRKADSAMYRVKSRTKGNVSVFDESLDNAPTERMAVEQRLRLAIRDRRFRCAFQPKVEMLTGKVSGVEVLLRWQDDQGIIRAPGDFIELAVELGLINDITFNVLEQTVQSMDSLEEAFGPDITVSINVAAKQACDIAFMTSLVGALAATGQPGRFMLELTEEAFFTTRRFQTDVLPLIRAIGARVSIDDFGVGYSSLAALADITADEIKIDRTFITDIHKRPRSQVVLKAIESLGLALGMSIIAEGVESAEEVAYLQSSTGIRHAQGFFFGRPMLLDQFLAAEAKPWGGRNAATLRRTQTRRKAITR